MDYSNTRLYEAIIVVLQVHASVCTCINYEIWPFSGQNSGWILYYSEIFRNILVKKKLVSLTCTTNLTFEIHLPDYIARLIYRPKQAMGLGLHLCSSNHKCCRLRHWNWFNLTLGYIHISKCRRLSVHVNISSWYYVMQQICHVISIRE